MRFVRYLQGKEAPRYGWVYEDRVGPIEGDLFGDYRRLEADIPLSKVRLLAPVVPSKIIAVGRNYVEHAREHNVDVPEIPGIFLKPPSSVIGPGDTVILPPQSERVEHEGELAIVIGTRGRWIPAEKANDFIFGLQSYEGFLSLFIIYEIRRNDAFRTLPARQRSTQVRLGL